jgi:hypothetical protein
MTTEHRGTLRKLRSNVKRYAPRIRKKLAKAGKKVNPAIVYSAAKYYKTLEKLAKE